MYVWAQSCPTLYYPMDCSLLGSSVHGIFQARVPEWGASAFSEYIAYVCTNAVQHIRTVAIHLNMWQRTLEGSCSEVTQTIDSCYCPPWAAYQAIVTVTGAHLWPDRTHHHAAHGSMADHTAVTKNWFCCLHFLKSVWLHECFYFGGFHCLDLRHGFLLSF